MHIFFCLYYYLLGLANDATGETAAGVASGFAELVAAAAQIVGVGVDDQRAAENAVLSLQGDERVLEVDVADAVVAHLDVAQVAGVAAALGVLGAAVLAFVQVEVGPGGGAAVGEVTKLMDVEAVEAGLEARHGSGHGDGTAALDIGVVAIIDLREVDSDGAYLLAEVDGPLDISNENTDGFQRHFENYNMGMSESTLLVAK